MIYKETQAKEYHVAGQLLGSEVLCGIVSEALPGTLSQWRLCGDGGDWAKIWTQ